MASHLLWFRLPKGRVWHVACSAALVALCGQSIPARGERQPKRPPFGARPCPDCDNVSAQVEFAMCDALRIRYEQEHPEDPGPYQHRIIPMLSSEPLFDGLKVTEADGGNMPVVDLVAALRASVEAAKARRAEAAGADES